MFDFKRAEEYSPQVLAYLGDAVFELYVRALLTAQANAPPDELHRRARTYVSAVSQAQMYHKLIDELTDEEQAVMKRGRNAKIRAIRSATVNDYRHATGLEALFGYLYMKGAHDRALWLFTRCISENNEEHDRTDD